MGAEPRAVRASTNLPGGSTRALYERTYCRRGEAENHLKAWKRHLAADRTSFIRATANQFRLTLHTSAYWLRWSLRSLMPKRSTWRLPLLHLPSACPKQAIMRLALGQLPRLVC